MNRMTCRSLLALCAILLAYTLTLSEAHAEKATEAHCREVLGSLRLQAIVPNAAGGGRDTLMRVLVRQLEQRYGFASVSVANIARGSTIPALLAVSKPRGSDLTIGIFNAQEIVLPGIDEMARPSRQEFALLATVVREPSVWLTKAGFDPSKAAGRRLILGSTSFNQAAVFDFLFPAEIFGAKPEIISSYEGSGELIAALLRGDVDVTTLRLSTATNALKSGGLSIAMTLTDGPSDASPSLPSLAGRAGLLAQASGVANPTSRARLEALASASVALSPTHLVIVTKIGHDAEVLDCIGGAAESIVLSSPFRDEAESLKQYVAPLGRAQTESLVNQMIETYGSMREEVSSALAPHLDAQ